MSGGNDTPPLNVLVVGAGMYVCGSDDREFGTILPTLLQEQHRGSVGEIHIAATRPASAAHVLRKTNALNERMGINGHVRVYPTGESVDAFAYRQAIEALPQPAAAIVSVPDHLHVSITHDIIAAGIHPLVVKPLCPTVDEALRLIAALDREGLYGAVEFHKRFDEANLIMRQKIRGGQLGDLCYAIVEFSQRRRIRQVFGSWVDQTNIFQYLGVHYADMIYFASGARPRRAMATGQAHSSDLNGPGNTKTAYDAIQAVVEWEMPDSGKPFVSTILTNWIDPDTTSAMSDQKITMIGTEGRYQSDQKNRGVRMVTAANGIEDINPYFTQFYQDHQNPSGQSVHGYGPASINCFLRDVGNLIAGKVDRNHLIIHRPSFQSALPSIAVVEAVNLSLEQDNRWISIKKGRIEH
jgi:predicted dehydrogenase